MNSVSVSLSTFLVVVLIIDMIANIPKRDLKVTLFKMIVKSENWSANSKNPDLNNSQ